MKRKIDHKRFFLIAFRTAVLIVTSLTIFNSIVSFEKKLSHNQNIKDELLPFLPFLPFLHCIILIITDLCILYILFIVFGINL
jgi:hypothetical protein